MNEIINMSLRDEKTKVEFKNNNQRKKILYGNIL